MVIFNSYVSLPEGTFSSVKKLDQVKMEGLPFGNQTW